MLNKIFKNINFLEKGMDAATLRHQVITNNIANVDTPNFKSSSVEFESLFKSAIQNDGFAEKRTRDKHIAFDSDISSIEPKVILNNTTTMRMDGNNVDIEYENTELAKNTIYTDILVEKLNSEISRLRLTINEGR